MGDLAVGISKIKLSNLELFEYWQQWKQILHACKWISNTMKSPKFWKWTRKISNLTKFRKKKNFFNKHWFFFDFRPVLEMLNVAFPDWFCWNSKICSVHPHVGELLDTGVFDLIAGDSEQRTSGVLKISRCLQISAHRRSEMACFVN